MKKQRRIEKDNRGVAIYARKSRITNKGDSIGVQFNVDLLICSNGINTASGVFKIFIQIFAVVAEF